MKQKYGDKREEMENVIAKYCSYMLQMGCASPAWKLKGKV